MMKYQDEKRLAGHTDQLIRVNRFRMTDGKADGAELLDVTNSSGLHFDVNISRGMDIPYLEYNGKNIGFVSACGIVAPQYFDDKGLGFLKSFTAGMMTTGGLKYAGGPCEYEGKEYGLHGNAANIPATQVSYKVVEEEIPYVLISGRVDDAEIFQDKLSLVREIRCDYKDHKILIHDTVKNEGWKKARHMILYHCNIGYPVLSPGSEIFIPTSSVLPRTEHAASGLDRWMYAEMPDPDYEEMCYYHTLIPDETGFSAAAIFNPEINLGISVEPDVSKLDHFIQWKMMGAGDYVMGLEPCNTTIDGIQDAVEKGTVKYLAPGETVTYDVVLRVLDGREEFEALKRRFA